MKTWFVAIALVGVFAHAQDQSTCPGPRQRMPTSNCNSGDVNRDIAVHVVGTATSPFAWDVANDTTTGTILNRSTGILSGKARVSLTTDIRGQGIVVGSAGTTGNTHVIVQGPAACYMRNVSHLNDMVAVVNTTLDPTLTSADQGECWAITGNALRPVGSALEGKVIDAACSTSCPAGTVVTIYRYGSEIPGYATSTYAGSMKIGGDLGQTDGNTTPVVVGVQGKAYKANPTLADGNVNKWVAAKSDFEPGSVDWSEITNTPVGAFVAVPATRTSACTAGQWSADANYHYDCYATNSWDRIAMDATWTATVATPTYDTHPMSVVGHLGASRP